MKAGRMEFAVLVSGLIVTASLGSAGAGQSHVAQEGYAWKDGAEVYQKLCALCHETKIGPVILGRGHDPLLISYMVRHGNRAMPAFRESEIDDQTLEKLAEYVSKAPADK